MKVVQIGLDFHRLEDRMLLKLATAPPQDLKYWITRRYFKILWDALMAALERHLSADQGLNAAARRAVLAMRQQDKLTRTDFKQPFKDAAPAPPAAGAEKPPPPQYPLLFGISISHPAANQWRLGLVQRDKAVVEMTLNDDMVISLCALMQKALAVADWGLKLPDFSSLLDTAQPGEERQLH